MTVIVRVYSQRIITPGILEESMTRVGGRGWVSLPSVNVSGNCTWNGNDKGEASHGLRSALDQITVLLLNRIFAVLPESADKYWRPTSYLE